MNTEATPYIIPAEIWAKGNRYYFFAGHVGRVAPIAKNRAELYIATGQSQLIAKPAFLR